MLQAIGRHLPGAVVHGAAAGIYLTVTFEDQFPDTALAAAALAEGVKVQPLSWHRLRPGLPGLVLGYAATTPGSLDMAVAKLGSAVAQLR